jgi:hypothetical protein
MMNDTLRNGKRLNVFGGEECLRLQALHLLLHLLEPEDVVTNLPLILVTIYQSTQRNIIGDLLNVVGDQGPEPRLRMHCSH